MLKRNLEKCKNLTKRNIIMKKFLSLVVAFACVVTVAGCSKADFGPACSSAAGSDCPSAIPQRDPGRG